MSTLFSFTRFTCFMYVCECVHVGVCSYETVCFVIFLFYCHILSKKDESKGLESVVCLATVDKIRKIYQGQPNVAVVRQRENRGFTLKRQEVKILSMQSM